MGLFSGSLDCDCCEEVLTLPCLSMSSPGAMTWFYNSRHTWPVGGSWAPVWNDGYTQKDTIYGGGPPPPTPNWVVISDSSDLPDPGYTFWKTSIGNNADAWTPPPDPWTNYPSLPVPEPSGPWGGWVWCQTRTAFGGHEDLIKASPPRYHYSWEDPANTSNVACPGWFPADTMIEDPETLAHCTHPKPQAWYKLDLGAVGFHKEFAFHGYGQAKDPVTLKPFGGSWFDYLKMRADRDWLPHYVSTTPANREYSFRARSYLFLSGGGTAWRFVANPPVSGQVGYSLQFDVDGVAITSVSANFGVKTGGTPSDVIRDGVAATGFGDFPAARSVTLNIVNNASGSSLYPNTAGGYGSWVNVDDWLKSLDPSDAVYFGIVFSPSSPPDPPTIEQLSQVYLPGYPGNHKRYWKLWKHVWAVEIQAFMEMEVTILDGPLAGHVGTCTFGGEGHW